MTLETAYVIYYKTQDSFDAPKTIHSVIIGNVIHAENLCKRYNLEDQDEKFYHYCVVSAWIYSS
jgi:hypothetical protein